MGKAEILAQFRPLFAGTGGIDSWLREEAQNEIFARLDALQSDSLTQASLNQLLTFNHEAAVSRSFFQYYWLKAPPGHPYDVRKVANFDVKWLSAPAITSLGPPPLGYLPAGTRWAFVLRKCPDGV